MSQTMTHTDSIQEENPHNESQKKQKSRRPANNAFRQQRLKAWQPILTPKTVLPIFFAVGIIFAPIGGLLLWASNTVQELVIDYTECTSAADAGTEFANIPSQYISSSFKSSNVSVPRWRHNLTTITPHFGAPQPDTRTCTIEYTLPKDFGAPVYLYYRLTNFYQNHRRYVKSLDLDQLRGHFLSNETIANSVCNPLKTNDTTGIAYYPCGLIANSIFNDTIGSPRSVSTSNGSTPEEYFMTRQGIAWASDLELYQQTAYNNSDVLPPPNWQLRFPTGYNETYPIPNLHEYEEFAVWMRTAGLPTFSKLARRNDNQTMRAGTYEIVIGDFFNVKAYGGTKSLLISTRTVMGGKNDFLGIAYLVVGGLCILLGAFFTVAHLIKPRKLGDHTYLSWNNDVAPTATTTGRDAGR